MPTWLLLSPAFAVFFADCFFGVDVLLGFDFDFLFLPDGPAKNLRAK